MLVYDFKTLIEFVKDILPFVVCIVTFIGALFLYKVALKTDRRNPLIYILSMISVIGLYFSFIKVMGLRRTDYFLDGFTLFMEQLEGVFTSMLFIFFAILSAMKCVDISWVIIFVSGFYGFLKMIYMFGDYITFTIESIYSNLINLKTFTINKITYIVSRVWDVLSFARSLICVFNC